jgi:hypothetical protein
MSQETRNPGYNPTQVQGGTLQVEIDQTIGVRDAGAAAIVILLESATNYKK